MTLFLLPCIQVKANTGALVVTKGTWLPDRTKATEKDPPLYIHVSATSQEILDKGVAAIEELLDMEMAPLVTDFRAKAREEREARLAEQGPRERRKWPEEKLPIGLQPLRNFNVRAKIVGPQGLFVKYIQNETAARVQIKGMGSGFVENETGRESDEPMHVHVSGPEQIMVDRAKELAEDLLIVVKEEWAKAKAVLDQWQQGEQQHHQQGYAPPPPSYNAPPPPPGATAPPPPVRVLRLSLSLPHGLSDTSLPSPCSPTDLLLPRRQAVPTLPLLQPPPPAPPLDRRATSSPRRKRSHRPSTSRCSNSTRVTRRTPQPSSTMPKWRSTTSSRGTLAMGSPPRSLRPQRPRRLPRSSTRVSTHMERPRRARTAASSLRHRAMRGRLTIRAMEGRIGQDKQKGSMAICRLRLDCSKGVQCVHAMSKVAVQTCASGP